MGNSVNIRVISTDRLFKLGQRVALLSYCAYAEYDVAREAKVIRLPDTLDGQPFPGEPLGCAMNVLSRSDIQPGQTVAIVGVGFLGALLAAISARCLAACSRLSRRSKRGAKELATCAS
jgi:NADPH:quinone reductase